MAQQSRRAPLGTLANRFWWWRTGKKKSKSASKEGGDEKNLKKEIDSITAKIQRIKTELNDTTRE